MLTNDNSRAQEWDLVPILMSITFGSLNWCSKSSISMYTAQITRRPSNICRPNVCQPYNTSPCQLSSRNNMIPVIYHQMKCFVLFIHSWVILFPVFRVCLNIKCAPKIISCFCSACPRNQHADVDIALRQGDMHKISTHLAGEVKTRLVLKQKPNWPLT